MSLKKLQARIAAEDTSENAAPLLVSEVPGMIVGFPTRVEEKDRHWVFVTYKWRGLTQSYEIRMPYDSSDSQPAILNLETKGAPAPKPVEYAEVAADDGAGSAESMSSGSPPGGPGGGATGSHAGGGPGGPGGGGQRPNLMDSDTDGDGKVSRAEAPERFAPNFDRVDANSDGFVDAEEYAEYRRVRAAERAAEGGGGPEGGRPQPAATPATDAPAEKSETPADAKAATEPAEPKTP